jgi:RHH-type transcriptional regulator, rel operon repressor / antitoxin RelB
MRSTTFTVRVDTAAKKRLEKLAKSTGSQPVFSRGRSDQRVSRRQRVQVAGIKKAITSLDRGEGVPHEQVKDWGKSWGNGKERPIPKRS